MKDIAKYDFNAPHSDDFAFEIDRIENKLILLQLGHKPRRDTFYAVFLIESGAGTHTIDFEQYSIAPDMLFCIAPGQVRYWNFTAEIRGWLILFTEDLLTTNLAYNTTHFPEDFTIFNWETPSGFLVPEFYRGRLGRLPKIMQHEYKNTDYVWRELAIQSALLLFLINVERAFIGNEQKVAHAADKLTRDFISLVNTNYNKIQSVKDYAHQLGITAGHLSDTIGALIGEPPQKIIHKRIILEAKRLLIHTELPASTIAEMLAFSDASYFGRFFKREVGETTKAYRQKFR